MADQDLETLFKPATFHIRGRDVPYRELTVEEALLAEYKGQSLSDDLQEEFEKSQKTPKGKGKGKGKRARVKGPTPEEILKIIAKRIREYMQMVLELTDEEVERVTLTEFQRFRREKEIQELRDQGFSDQEIEQLKREVAKKNFRDALGAISATSSTSTD